MAADNNLPRMKGGGEILERVRSDVKKRFKIILDYKMPVVRVKEVDKNCRSYRCCMCGTVYVKQAGNFLNGGNSILWKGNNGFVPFCKTCGETLMDAYTHLYGGNEEHALRHLCQIFDWYYSEMASAMTLSQVHCGSSRLPLYPSKMAIRQVAAKGETFMDTLKDEQGEYEKIQSVEQIPDASEADPEDDFTVTKTMIRTWGVGFTPEQYRYLEEEYQDWVSKNVCNTKSQEELYRNIALAQLDVRIARQNGGKVSDAQKALQDLMNSANILPRQTSENILADTQTFGTLLKKFEETNPIPEPDEEWRDVDGIKKYVNAWFKGGLAKALKIKSEHADLYDEEVAKEYDRYTVEPSREAQEEEMSIGSIFDGTESPARAENGDGDGTDTK